MGGKFIGQRTLRNIHQRAVRQRSSTPQRNYPGNLPPSPNISSPNRMFPHGFTERAEDNSFLHQRFLEGSLYGSRSLTASTAIPLRAICSSKGIPSLLNVFINSGSDFLHALRSFFLLRRIGIIRNRLIVNFGDTEMCPSRHLQRQPVAVRFPAKLQQPLRFVFFR